MPKFFLNLFYGFLLWVIPFAITYLFFPMFSPREYLGAAMPVLVALMAMVFLYLSLRRVRSHFVREGVWLGMIWFVICVGMDFFMFIQSKSSMDPLEHMGEILPVYLIIPVVSVGFSAVIERMDSRLNR